MMRLPEVQLLIHFCYMPKAQKERQTIYLLIWEIQGRTLLTKSLLPSPIKTYKEGWLKIYSKFSELVDFSYWWSCIGMGLHTACKAKKGSTTLYYNFHSALAPRPGRVTVLICLHVCLFVCLSVCPLPIYFIMSYPANILQTPNIFTDSGPSIK